MSQTVILCLKGVITVLRGPANNEAYILFSFFIFRKKRREEASTMQNFLAW